MLEVVVASSNPEKIAEITQILSRLSVRLLTREETGGWGEVEETGATYLENALIKAREVMRATGRAALADDSGIEVDHLGGAPGVLSARFAGPHASDEENNAHLASLMAEVPAEERTARYRCVAVISFPDGRELGGVGVCEGRIATEPRGSGGFGYDPWFVPAGRDRTMAELPTEEKHAISHRGRALRGLADQLERTLGAPGSPAS